MSAASQTWTFDTVGMKYIDRNMISHTIVTNQTARFNHTDVGTNGPYIVPSTPATSIKCTDGFRFNFSCEKASLFTSVTDNVAAPNAGELTIYEDGFNRHPWKVKSLTMANCDGVAGDNITTITLESLLHGRTITWTTLNTA